MNLLVSVSSQVVSERAVKAGVFAVVFLPNRLERSGPKNPITLPRNHLVSLEHSSPFALGVALVRRKPESYRQGNLWS